MSYEVPRLRHKVCDDKLTVPMESELKREILALRRLNVEPLEWIRRVLRAELPRVRELATESVTAAEGA